MYIRKSPGAKLPATVVGNGFTFCDAICDDVQMIMRKWVERRRSVAGAERESRCDLTCSMFFVIIYVLRRFQECEGSASNPAFKAAARYSCSAKLQRRVKAL